MTTLTEIASKAIAGLTETEFVRVHGVAHLVQKPISLSEAIDKCDSHCDVENVVWRVVMKALELREEMITDDKR